jgi:high-affinity K+ transport system ATPase subunit B
MSRKQLALLEPTLVRQALLDAVKKLSPMVQWRNPVMFIVWVGSLLTTLLAMPWRGPCRQRRFTAAVSIWLWFTVLFANFAEAMAEGRSKAQANSLKGVKKPPSPASCARRSMMRGRPRAGGRPAQRRRGAGGSRGYYSLRWRSHRRRRLGG